MGDSSAPVAPPVAWLAVVLKPLGVEHQGRNSRNSLDLEEYQVICVYKVNVVM